MSEQQKEKKKHKKNHGSQKISGFSSCLCHASLVALETETKRLRNLLILKMEIRYNVQLILVSLIPLQSAVSEACWFFYCA